MGPPANAQTYGMYTCALALLPDRGDMAYGPFNVLTLRDNTQRCNDFPVDPEAN